VLVCGATAPARAQISPGRLAAPHAALEGALRCVTCHGTKGKSEMTARCRACHAEIAWLQDQGRGFHARHAAESCASCHPDHAGNDFALIKWPAGAPERFDHATTGWPLAGAHDSLRCNRCHTTTFRTTAARNRLPDPTTAPGWVGLDGTCTACHGDPHRGTLNHDCATCHDATRWTTVRRFDHARTDYPLRDKHAAVRCGSCHAPGVRRANDTLPPVSVFKPVAHADCVNCHTDPHGGRFAGPCRDCHVTSGFEVIDRGNFNHDRTRFPLRGRHAAVACAACHEVPGHQSRHPPFATCAACHADPHAGTATLAGAAVDCAACHDVTGFAVPTYTVAQHQTARFRLEGKHAQLACQACHIKNPRGVPAAQLGSAGILMRPASARCRDCHADDHGGQLAARADNGECSACHTPAGWKPSTFTVAAHATLRLPLEGRHAEIACAACHAAAPVGLPPATGPLGKAAVSLHPHGSDCVACHMDPHQGRFGPGGAQPVPGGCRGCHTLRSFHPSTIDVATHASYEFSLEGAHRAVPCLGCHGELRHRSPQSSLALVRWVGAPLLFTTAGRSCVVCHQSPHGDQFARASGGAGCERCHDLVAFRPAGRFEHDRDTRFPLRGGHANLPCARCHPTTSGSGGIRTVRYQGVSGRCENCHAGAVSQ
jgi:cytochrome c7-like protein/class III cytochrome C family protein